MGMVAEKPKRSIYNTCKRDGIINIIGSYIKLSNNTNKYNGKSC